jgi:hypothetical protein
MHNGTYAVHGGSQSGRVTNVCDYELKSISEKGVTSRQVVIDSHLMPGTPQGVSSVAANVACPTDYQDKHSQSRFSPKLSLAIFTIAFPIGIDAVAAGEGTLSTCSICGPATN